MHFRRRGRLAFRIGSNCGDILASFAAERNSCRRQNAVGVVEQVGANDIVTDTERLFALHKETAIRRNEACAKQCIVGVDDDAIAAIGLACHENRLAFDLHRLDCNRQSLRGLGCRLVGLGGSFGSGLRIVLRRAPFPAS